MLGLSSEGAAFDTSMSPSEMSIAAPPSRGPSFAAAFGAAEDREGEQYCEKKKDAKEREKETEKAPLYWQCGAVPSPPPAPQTMSTRSVDEGTEVQELPPTCDSLVPVVGKTSRELSLECIPEATGTTASLVGQQQEGGGGVRDKHSLSPSRADDSPSRSLTPGAGPLPAAATALNSICSPVPIPIPMQRSSTMMIASNPLSLWTRSSSYVGRDVPPRGVDGGVVEDRSTADSVYQAFVRKWCFANEDLKG